MNKMPEVAKLLGVEMGEWFRIRGWEDRFRLTEEGLEKCDGELYPASLQALLNGQYEIAKLPFRPKKGETYYYITSIGYVDCDYMDMFAYDFAYIAFGNCFRSRAEAEANKDKILAKFAEIRKEMEQ